MSTAGETIRGKVYVLGDNIDTDQIIPACYLNLVPTIPEEYRALGAHAMSGLPDGAEPFIEEATSATPYAIIVAGRNFGCGSSREHAPIALGAAGVKAVVAQSYARIFFRNSIATGELYPLESEGAPSDAFRTGDVGTIDLAALSLTHEGTGKSFPLVSLGEAKPVIEAGGLFKYARAVGMIEAG